MALSSFFMVAACAATPPSGPSVLGLAGQGKTFPQFQQDDAQCRNYAQGQLGGVTPGQAATNSAIGSAAVGTALGVAAGALIGSASGNLGAGAAIGAGTGLLGGSLVGAGAAGQSSEALQQHYDNAYIQCMTGNGENVQAAAPVTRYPTYAYDEPVYGYPEPIYVEPPPVIGFGFGFGGGGWRHGGWGHHGGPGWGRGYGRW